MPSEVDARPSDAILETAEKSGALSNWLGERIDSLGVPNTERCRLGGACLHVSLSHHVAIASLIRDGRFASAFALLRPQIDGYVRGLWLHHLATDDDIEGVKHGDDPPNTRKIAKALEDTGKLDSDSLSKIADGVWPTVCDFTHTGIRVIYSHLTAEEIRPAFEDDIVNDFFLHSDVWALLTGIAIADMASNQSLAREIGERAMELMKAS